MTATHRLLGTAVAACLAFGTMTSVPAASGAQTSSSSAEHGTDSGRAARMAGQSRHLGFRDSRLDRAPQLRLQGRLMNVADAPVGESPWYVLGDDGGATQVRADWDLPPTPGAEFDGTVALSPHQAERHRVAAGRAASPAQSRRVLAAMADATLPVARAMITAPVRRVHSGARPHRVFVAFASNLGDLGEPLDASLARIAAASDYWVDESDGIVAGLTVAGTAPVSLPVGVAEGCGLGAGTSFATQAAAAKAAFPGVTPGPSVADHIVVFVPAACIGAGAAGRADQYLSFDSGGVAIIGVTPGTNQATASLVHEFGHNFGLGHSGIKRGCQNVEDGSGCTVPEVYGDWYSPMGNRPADFPYSPALPTRFRVFEGITAPGELSEFSLGTGVPASTPPITLSPRVGETGLRSVSFINPDNGDRFYLDLRDGTDRDAPTVYAPGVYKSNDGYLQNRGIVMEAEDAAGNYLQRSPAMTAAWTAGQVWQNDSKSFSVSFGATTVALNYAGAPPLSPGSATITGDVRAQQVVEAVGAGFTPAANGFSYQWKANGVAIPGATLKKFYIPVGLAGAQLSVDVTGYATGRHPATVSASAAVAPAKLYGAEQTLPTISGTAQVGQTLTATGGTSFVDYFGQTPVGLNVYYQWNDGTTAIPGAVGPNLALPGSLAGHYLSVSQVADAPGFETQFFRTGGYGPVARGTIASASRPKIKGKVRVGARVKAKVNRRGWDDGVAFKFRWLANGKPIRGRKGKALRVSRSLRGKRLQVMVTGTKLGYEARSVKSKPKRVR